MDDFDFDIALPLPPLLAQAQQPLERPAATAGAPLDWGLCAWVAVAVAVWVVL